ncbi:MAG: anti-toxin [Candidatus Paracaedibacteraceae bacterium]|nr:anti-toxin [Candidatus Paracaedibacteraceae bacterium]
MLTVRVPDSMEKQLGDLALKTNRSKSYWVKKAIEELLEDRNDYLEALSAYEKEGKRFSSDEVETMLGLKDE